MKATVIIPTYNRATRLTELLGCLEPQREQIERVVVCDDGSTDGTSEVALTFADRLPIDYARQEHLGFRAGQARNMGIARARGDVAIFVDDDVLVEPSFVARHLAAHEGAHRPRVAIGYRARAFAPLPESSERSSAEPDDRVPELGEDAVGVTSHPTPWFFVYSCNFSMTLTTPTPMYDEGFVGWGMEDIEFGYRLHKLGYEIVAAPGTRVLHIDDEKPRDPFRCEARTIEPVYDSYVLNSIYFMDKYPEDTRLAERIRADLRWYVRDEALGRWVKNGYENDINAVITQARREMEQRR